MCKVVEVKKELETLIYDIERGKELGTSEGTLLNAATNKIRSLIDKSNADYMSVRWEK